MPGGERLKRIKWLCRRGMKELDMLLEDFVLRHPSELQGGDWPEFEDLLACEDDQLWAWLQHPPGQDAGRFRELLELIRHERTN